jgi:cellulose synthase/poly-beta-1,6-N-acetylglucosamine synthase-like glycosyltransferase
MAIPVSVGICAYNEEKNIGNVLNLLHNTKVRGFKIIEILVVASGCTDRTCDIIKEWQKKDKRIKLIVERKRRGKIHALNKIIKRCKGKIFMNVDADQYFDKHAIQLILNRLKNDKVGAVSSQPIGITSEKRNRKFTEKMIEVIQKLYMERQKHSLLKNKFELYGLLFAFKKELCNYIPEDVINDDVYIAVLCKSKGYKSLVEKRAKSYIKSPTILMELINQRRRHIYGNLIIKKKTGIEAPKLITGFDGIFLIILKFFLKEGWKAIVYFLTERFVEFCANILARVDLLKKYNPHIVWKIAKTTKNLNEFYPNYEKVK